MNEYSCESLKEVIFGVALLIFYTQLTPRKYFILTRC